MDEKETRMSELYERLNEKYEQFREGLLRLSKTGIMDCAFQISARDDIMMLFESHEFEQPDIEALLTLENPLEEIYQEWRDFDGSSMDDLFSCVDNVICDARKRQRQPPLEETPPPESDTEPRMDTNTFEWTLDKMIENEHVLAILEGPLEADFAMLDQAYKVLKNHEFIDPIDREILMTYDRPLETVALKMELEMTDAEGGIALAIKERRDNLQFFHDHLGQLPNFMQIVLRQFEGHCANVIGQPIIELSDYENWSFQAEDINKQDMDDGMEQ